MTTRCEYPAVLVSGKYPAHDTKVLDPDAVLCEVEHLTRRGVDLIITDQNDPAAFLIVQIPWQTIRGWLETLKI